VTEVVIEVGPCAIRGPNVARAECISTALECIDDDVALLDERIVPVQNLWDDVISAVAGDGIDAIVVVCPTWWSSQRVDRVRMAALTVAPTVTVLHRTEMFRDGVAHRVTTIVELAPDLVVVSRPAADIAVLTRDVDSSGDTDSVVAAVGPSAAVLLDAPVGVEGAERLAVTVAECLHLRGIPVSFAPDVMLAGVRTRPSDDAASGAAVSPPAAFRDRRGAAVLAGVLSASVLCVGFSLRGDNNQPTEEVPMTFLIEGRIGVMVPADWAAQRITSGPGSARVQVVSPNDSDVALHITQSVGQPDSGLAEMSTALLAALGTQPAGVFVDFNPSDTRGGKPAVTYRELRRDHETHWAVQVDGAVRIAIGCQSARGHERSVSEVCERAIRSAHAVF
jgi:type VII secretion-associated protein (TIGR03931 family)